MSDTTVGDITDTNGVAIGHAAHVQTVTVTIPLDEPPEPTIKEQIKSIRFAVLALNQMFVSDRAEREQRQRVTDESRQQVVNRLEMIDRIVWGLHAETRVVRWMSAGGWVAVAALAAAMARLLGWW